MQYQEPVAAMESIDYSTFSHEIPTDLNDVVQLVHSHIVNHQDINNDQQYDYGHDYDWSTPKIPLPSSIEDAGQWLIDIIEKEEEKELLSKDPPVRADGKPYSIDECTDDQKEVLAYILYHLKLFIDYGLDLSDEKPEQLFITIRGEAGTGKTVLLNTLVTIMLSLFENVKTTDVCSPTGNSAFNAGGCTCHKKFRFSHIVDPLNMSESQLKSLLTEFAYNLIIALDERSLLCSRIFGAIFTTCNMTMHQGLHKHLPFGGLPIFILLGDDFQIPSVEVGALFALAQKYGMTSDLTIQGHEQFRIFGKNVMTLHTQKRQDPSQQEFQQILQASRGETETELTESMKDRLLDLRIMKPHFSDSDRKKLNQMPCIYLQTSCQEINTIKKIERNKYT